MQDLTRATLAFWYLGPPKALSGWANWPEGKRVEVYRVLLVPLTIPARGEEAEPTAGCCAHHDLPASNVSARFDGLVAEKIDCLCAKRRESHTPPHTQISNGLWALKLWHLDRANPPKWAVTLSFCRSLLKAIFRPCVPFRARRVCVWCRLQSLYRAHSFCALVTFELCLVLALR